METLNVKFFNCKKLLLHMNKVIEVSALNS